MRSTLHRRLLALLLAPLTAWSVLALCMGCRTPEMGKNLLVERPGGDTYPPSMSLGEVPLQVPDAPVGLRVVLEVAGPARQGDPCSLGVRSRGQALRVRRVELAEAGITYGDISGLTYTYSHSELFQGTVDCEVLCKVGRASGGRFFIKAEVDLVGFLGTQEREVWGRFCDAVRRPGPCEASWRGSGGGRQAGSRSCSPRPAAVPGEGQQPQGEPAWPPQR